MVSVCFIADGRELRLPVTPMFSAPAGKRIETVNIHQVGDVNLPGKPSPAPITLEGFFPAHPAPYAIGEISEPYEYVQQFEAWAKGETVVRYVVTDTSINLPVLIESIEYGEEDGTGDVYYTLRLVEYTYLTTTVTEAVSTGNSSRKEEAPAAPQSYTVQKGDTLSAIARRYYGNSSMAYRLATANSIKNPNLIYPGQVLSLPDTEELKGVEPAKAPSIKKDSERTTSERTTVEEVPIVEEVNPLSYGDASNIISSAAAELAAAALPINGIVKMTLKEMLAKAMSGGK